MTDEQTIARMTEIRNLIEEFGLTLYGFDPGVTAWIKNDPNARGDGYCGEPIAFERKEWQWLEPILKELKELRAKKHKVNPKQQDIQVNLVYIKGYAKTLELKVGDDYERVAAQRIQTLVEEIENWSGHESS